MPEQLWVAPLKRTNIASAAAFNSFTTFTAVTPIPDVVIPANTLTPGYAIKIEAAGRFSSNGTPNLTFAAYLGGVAGTQVCSTAAMTTFTTAVNSVWRAEFDLYCWTEGTSGTCRVTGQVLGIMSSTSAVVALAPPSAGGAITIDTTAAKSVVLAASFSAQHGLNQVIVDQWRVTG